MPALNTNDIAQAQFHNRSPRHPPRTLRTPPTHTERERERERDARARVQVGAETGWFWLDTWRYMYLNEPTDGISNSINSSSSSSSGESVGGGGAPFPGKMLGGEACMWSEQVLLIRFDPVLQNNSQIHNDFGLDKAKFT